MNLLSLILPFFINIGPKGGVISDFEIAPFTQDIYAVLSVGGLYRSSNHANTWLHIVKYPDSLYFKEFVNFKVSPLDTNENLMYAIVKGDNDLYSAYITFDKGNTWYPETIPIQDSTQKSCGLVTLGAYVFWGFADAIYLTEFVGNYINTLFPPGPPYKELSKQDSILLLSSNGGFYTSADGGNTWNPEYTLSEVTSAILLPPNPDTVDAVISIPILGVRYRVNGVWRSSNLTGSFVRKFFLNNGVLFAIEGVRIWRSFDHGKNFEEIFIPDTLNFIVSDVVAFADTLFFGTTGGLLISYDNGSNYYFRNGDMRAFVIFDVTAHPSIKKNSVLSIFGPGPVRVINMGSDYRINNRGMLLPYVWQTSYHPSAPETLYTVNAWENKVYRFSGGMWDSLLKPPSPPSFVYVHPDTSLKNFYYVGTKNGLYISKDYGNTWISRLPNYTIVDLKFLPKRGDTVPIIAGTHSNGFFISRDTGFTFTQIPYFPKDSNLAGFDINPLNRDEIYILSELDKLYRTQDGGNTWDTLTLPHSSEFLMFSGIKVLPSDKGIFYVSQIGADGIYRFFEKGDTFFYFLRNIHPPPVISLEIAKLPKGAILYAGSFEGAWAMMDTLININFNVFDDTVFTPEGDGIDDSVRFEISIFDSANIGKTEVSVIDTSGKVYITTAYPPSEYFFNKSFWYFGYDSSGKQIPPGRYLCQIKSYDGFANEKMVQIPFHINYIPLQTGNRDAFMNFNQRKVAKGIGATYIVYTSWGDNSEVYYTFKGTGNWHYPMNVSNTFHSKSYMPSISSRTNTGIVYIESGSNAPLRIYLSGIDTLLRIARPRECSDPFILEDDFGDFHVVWSEKPAGIFNRIFYMKLRGDGSIAISPIEILNISSGDLHSLYLCEDSLGNLNLFFENTTTQKIYHIKGDLDGVWGSEEILFDGKYPQAIVDNLSRIFLFRIFNSDLYLNVMEEDTWSSDYKVNISQSVVRYTTSIDSIGNLYVIFETPDSSLYLRVRDNLGNWSKIQSLGKGNYPQMPEKFNSKFYVLNLKNIPYVIEEKNLSSYGDTIPPSFTFQFTPSELIVGQVDTIRVYSSEILGNLPEFYIVKDDSFVPLSIEEDTSTFSPLDYISYFDSKGFDIGKVIFEVRGIDLAGNQGVTIDSLIVKKSGEFVPEHRFAIYPNPVENTDEVHISYYINENADVKVMIYTITGRCVETIKQEAKGGMRNEVVWRFDKKVNSGLYLVVFEARGKNTGEFKRIIKRLGVIR